MSILFITSTRIGDAVLTTGLLDWLLRHYPEHGVTIACGAPAAPIFEPVPRLERLHVIEKQAWKRHWLDLWLELRRGRWEIVVDLRNSVIPWLVRAKKKAVLTRIDEHVHRVELIARTLDLPPQAPVLWTRQEHDVRAVAIVRSGSPVVAISANVTWPRKMWPVERYAELAHRITAADGILAGGRVLLIGSLIDREAAAPFLELFPRERLIDGFGIGIPNTYAALRRCSLMVGNDSGLMHVAAASGIPTVGLFGPTRAECYAPWGPNGLVVRAPQPPPKPDRPVPRTTNASMMDIQVSDVEAAIRERWPDLQ